MKFIVPAALAALILAVPALAQAEEAKGLEVRFCPSGQVRTYPLEAHRDIQSLLLQNTVVVNRGTAPVEVGQVDVALMAKGVAVDEKHLAGDDLKAFAANGAKIQAGGMLAMVGFQFCGDRVIEKDMKLSGPVLQPGEAMLLTYQAFAFRKARDAVRVTVRDTSGAVRGEGTIAINEQMSKTGFIWPLKGAWFAGVGPTMHTGHRWGVFEEFAFDIAKIGEGNTTYRGDGQKFSDYYAYGAEVLAAADGKVVDIVNDAPEDANFLRRVGESADAYGARVQDDQQAAAHQGRARDRRQLRHHRSRQRRILALRPPAAGERAGEARRRGETGPADRQTRLVGQFHRASPALPGLRRAQALGLRRHPDPLHQHPPALGRLSAPAPERRPCGGGQPGPTPGCGLTMRLASLDAGGGASCSSVTS